jgi:gamma-glutamylcyclotransferase (GGCT)/AIG2-like uncharacterized protein YtfP
MQRLFVYGTLAPGRSNHHILKGVAGSWQQATLKGTLFQQGWGAAMGYPGIIPSEDGDEIEGFVFSSKYLDEHWPRVDEFEGAGYTRKLVTVKIEGGVNKQAFVYALSE